MTILRGIEAHPKKPDPGNRTSSDADFEKSNIGKYARSSNHELSSVATDGFGAQIPEQGSDKREPTVDKAGRELLMSLFSHNNVRPRIHEGPAQHSVPAISSDAGEAIEATRARKRLKPSE
ncbi:hypothetical protein MMC10_003298 [Thelotrema lepadinum]|nr:hypothetical protein [Thelotrema lepadinum]